MMDCDVLVVGAGVVGLACAQRLAADGREVMVLEQEDWPGQHASSRNSEVIHAGIYYAPGSLKAELCRRGRDQLYRWCEARQVPHRRIGKVLVAVEENELPALQALHDNALANEVRLDWLDAAQVHALEPQVRAVAGLLSPITGIIDSHALMQSYEAALQERGGQVVCRVRVERIEPIAGGYRVHGSSGRETFALHTRALLNAGGLFATTLASRIEGYPAVRIPQMHYCKGSYFSYSGRSPFSHLVYPMPEANTSGLGVHATLDLGGQLRFGPDVCYQSDLDYQVDLGMAERFASAVQRYWPACDPLRLVPGYAGIRAKLSGPGQPAMDFLIEGPAEHGLPGLISLYGIESPGLTASLAIADEVANRLDNL
ncbi:NAD(P)/FAD-dependent oxidoreductase [Halopseudomonas nanhaiensis]|uniref:NAD(P)/FAD-dependent oxidoreductase n=1 Tax=Halopseudomonas nanhaiensis TaxID=2830842 RepID=UPI001CBCC83A|nr:NAD(P)/FAD-dependent oxidoreductase [Halopseudomonas nanhaiensis]UAW99941.1 NAD(P)/FAD-dependent oxidoreductase [Halopseudomonas nanhaiensis]